jgi:hypothetical protein
MDINFDIVQPKSVCVGQMMQNERMITVKAVF